MVKKLFQFHEGPIKTVRKMVFTIDLYAFQFHEGPIKTLTGELYSFSLFHVSIP